MLNFLRRVMGTDYPGSSKKVAKERLRLVLLHDRTSIPPHVLEALKSDLIACISKYMEIDNDNLDINLTNERETVALVANIPIMKVKSS